MSNLNKALIIFFAIAAVLAFGVYHAGHNENALNVTLVNQTATAAGLDVCFKANKIVARAEMSFAANLTGSYPSFDRTTELSKNFFDVDEWCFEVKRAVYGSLNGTLTVAARSPSGNETKKYQIVDKGMNKIQIIPLFVFGVSGV